MRKLVLVILVLTIGFAGGVFYKARTINRGKNPIHPDFKRSIGVTVRVEKPIRKDMFETIKASGNLEAINKVEVISQIPGIIESCLVREGDEVKKGDVLAKLDDDEVALNYRQAQTALTQALVNKENLAQTLRRNEELYKDQLISDQQIEQIRAQYALAESQVKSARVALDMAKLNLSRATIRAPMSGKIAMRNCEINQRVTGAEPLFRIADLSKLQVKIYVTEDDVHRIEKEKRPVRLTFDALRGGQYDRVYEGRVTFISPVVNPESGTVEVKVEVTNSEGVLTEGMFARLVVETALHANALVVPKQALIGEEGRYEVFVAIQKDGEDKFIAHQVDVKTGISDDTYVEITTGDIDENSLVVVEGQNLLSEGDIVVFASSMESTP